MASHDPRLRGPALALLVIDQLELADAVKLALNHSQYRPRVVPTMSEASAVLAEWHPHLVILDVDLAGALMLDRLGGGPESTERPPIVALTRRGDLDAKLTAFEAGVDDILTLPFSPQELVARVLALVRRTYRDAAVFTPVLRLGELEIDVLNRRVRVGAASLHLTAIEQSLLYLLAANAGQLLTRDEILDYLWGTEYVAESNLVDRHIRNLRMKLGEHSGGPRCIATVPGRGYRFVWTLPEPASSATKG